MRINAGWPAVHGRPNILAAPIAGSLTTATREQHPNKHSGSFSCEVCRGNVHAWSGNYDFFDWKVDQAKPSIFGKRWRSCRGSPPNVGCRVSRSVAAARGRCCKFAARGHHAPQLFEPSWQLARHNSVGYRFCLGRAIGSGWQGPPRFQCQWAAHPGGLKNTSSGSERAGVSGPRNRKPLERAYLIS
jgi:hypothetical protein